tara:strand:- start:2911 stop:3732 length:822 start_codon:yes stop_codon:yes gene_type:complete
MQLQIGKEKTVDEGMFRHMALNSLRYYRQKFGDEYGELVICCEDRHIWRKEFFPQYKQHRKKERSESDLDWGMIFDTINIIRDELIEFFPYKVLQVRGAEADDIIATLCHAEGDQILRMSDPILIMSSDKDFRQLHTYANVDQYSPIQKKWIKETDPEGYLREHILRGDRGDGVPNFLTGDDALLNGERQAKLTKTTMDKWMNEDPTVFCENENQMRGYLRNKRLVDLSEIPSKLQFAIMEAYMAENTNGRGKLFQYFIDKRLKFLMSRLGEF